MKQEDCSDTSSMYRMRRSKSAKLDPETAKKNLLATMRSYSRKLIEKKSRSKNA